MIPAIVGPVENYAQMLTKIFLWTFALSLVGLCLLAWQVPALGALFSAPPFSVSLSGHSIPLGVVLPALAFAAISAIVKLHDRVSDLLRLRSRFDVQYILLSMVEVSGRELTDDLRSRLRAQRRHLMSTLFYRYASGSEGKTLIDRHSVVLALTQWSWFWVLVEGMVVAALTGLTALSFGARGLGLACGICIVASILVCYASWHISARYARQQVGEILADPGRAQYISGILNAI